MKQLPIWNIPTTFPAVWDMESMTAIEQAARVYAAMRELIEEYNKFAESVNQHIATFTDDETEAREEFEEDITKVIREFICSSNEKFERNMKDIETIVTAAVKDYIESAEVRIEMNEEYDPNTKALTISLNGGVNNE